MKYLVPFLFVASMAQSEPSEIKAAEAQRNGDTWRFSVTVAHPDTGWDHYADGWRVELEDGTILGTRVLAHPHVNEQPFTRSLGGVAIPEGIATVFIREKCSVDGWGKTRLPLDLP